MKVPGTLFWSFLAAFALIRIPLDTTRAYEPDAVLVHAGIASVTESQLTSIALGLFAMLMLLPADAGELARSRRVRPRGAGRPARLHALARAAPRRAGGSRDQRFVRGRVRHPNGWASGLPSCGGEVCAGSTSPTRSSRRRRAPGPGLRGRAAGALREHDRVRLCLGDDCVPVGARKVTTVEGPMTMTPLPAFLFVPRDAADRVHLTLMVESNDPSAAAAPSRRSRSCASAISNRDPTPRRARREGLPRHAAHLRPRHARRRAQPHAHLRHGHERVCWPRRSTASSAFRTRRRWRWNATSATSAKR